MGKAEGYFFLFVAVFFAVCAPIYWFISYEWAGTVFLVLACLLGALCAFYLLMANRRMGDRPEDRPYAEVEEGAGDIAHFSPYSVWPISLAASAVAGLWGFAFGLWITYIAAGFVLITLCGLMFEHYRGWHLHTEEETGIDPIGLGGGHG